MIGAFKFSAFDVIKNDLVSMREQPKSSTGLEKLVKTFKSLKYQKFFFNRNLVHFKKSSTHKIYLFYIYKVYFNTARLGKLDGGNENQ